MRMRWRSKSRLARPYMAPFRLAASGAGESGTVTAAELSRFDAEAGNVAAALEHAHDDEEACRTRRYR